MGQPDPYTGLTSIRCCACGVVFGMSNALRDQRVLDRDWFWCPNGHQQHFTGPSEADRLRGEVDRLKRELDSANSGRRWAQSQAHGAAISAGKAKAAKRRLEQRVAAGVCPCCNRTFEQLARHMKTKHPEFKGS